MERDLFFRFGKLIYHLRWYIVVLWLVLFCLCLPFVPKMFDPYKSIGFVDPTSQSAIADTMINKNFGYGINNRFIVLYSNDKLIATDEKFQSEIKQSLSKLKKLSIKHVVIYPDVNNKSQISKDKHTAYAVIAFRSDQEIDSAFLTKLRSYISKPKNLTMKIGGEPVFLDDTKEQTQRDLYKAEYFATPVAIITMLVVYGSVVAASLPIIFSGIGMIFILIALFFFAQTFDLSVFTINIALLLGLCLSLDYALFIISRFREEISLDQTTEHALGNTMLTAGKAIFFSGLAVFISLSSLLLFRVNVLFSVGVGGLTAVFVSVAIAIILLPSILAILNHKINALPLPFINQNKNKPNRFWEKTGLFVIKHKFAAFFSTLIVLLLIGYPFYHAVFDISGFRILPKNMESRQVFDKFEKQFGEAQLTPILLVVKTRNAKVLTEKNIGYLYDLTTKLKKDKRIDDITSIVTTDPRLSKDKYQMLYTHPQLITKDVDNMLKLMVHKNVTVITLISKYPRTAPETSALIKTLRALKPGHGFTLQVTGSAVSTIDVLNSIAHTVLYAFLLVIGFNYLIMLFLLRSVVLPLKAIFMTMLSLFSSYGVLVFIFQYGYGHEWLNFEPQKMLDISMVIIIFSALFGVSMDYEVFLLTRIKERYEITKDTNESIVYGIDHSGKIITSAAIILILICLVFMTADILLVKAFGLGIAVAVFIDAFLIRTILVPATMAILKSWNWYLPKWLDKILPQVTFKPLHEDKAISDKPHEETHHT